MKAAQIYKYSKEIKVSVNDVPVPEPQNGEVLIRVKAAAVNPLDILQISGGCQVDTEL